MKTPIISILDKNNLISHNTFVSGCGEMADAHVSGTCGQPCGFKSHHPHQTRKKRT